MKRTRRRKQLRPGEYAKDLKMTVDPIGEMTVEPPGPMRVERIGKLHYPREIQDRASRFVADLHKARKRKPIMVSVEIPKTKPPKPITAYVEIVKQERKPIPVYVKVLPNKRPKAIRIPVRTIKG